jgi:lipopolysaccharide transport system permease protein
MNEQTWDLVIDANDKRGRASFKKIWQYRDLLNLLVRRDFVAFYKQTILGPIWFFIRPIVATIVYFFIFGKVAGLSTDGVPPVLFYLSGLMIWSYFTETVTKCSGVLLENSAMFGKVYFPRLIMPLSIIFSNMLRLGVQFLLLVVIFIYYFITSDTFTLTPAILFVPILILIVSFQAAGLGLLVAAVATKYRDFSMLLGYLLQLGLFLAPVVFPLSSISGKFKLMVSFNPMTFPIELFRHSFFGTGSFSTLSILYMIMSTMIMLFAGVYAFNKYEKTFVDTI